MSTTNIDSETLPVVKEETSKEEVMVNVKSEENQNEGVTTVDDNLSAQSGSNSGDKSATSVQEPENVSRKFANTFKNILSSVLKTDIGQVFKTKTIDIQNSESVTVKQELDQYHSVSSPTLLKSGVDSNGIHEETEKYQTRHFKFGTNIPGALKDSLDTVSTAAGGETKDNNSRNLSPVELGFVKVEPPPDKSRKQSEIEELGRGKRLVAKLNKARKSAAATAQGEVSGTRLASARNRTSTHGLSRPTSSYSYRNKVMASKNPSKRKWRMKGRAEVPPLPQSENNMVKRVNDARKRKLKGFKGGTYPLGNKTKKKVSKKKKVEAKGNDESIKSEPIEPEITIPEPDVAQNETDEICKDDNTTGDKADDIEPTEIKEEDIQITVINTIDKNKMEFRVSNNTAESGSGETDIPEPSCTRELEDTDDPKTIIKATAEESNCGLAVKEESENLEEYVRLPSEGTGSSRVSENDDARSTVDLEHDVMQDIKPELPEVLDDPEKENPELSRRSVDSRLSEDLPDSTVGDVDDDNNNNDDDDDDDLDDDHDIDVLSTDEDLSIKHPIEDFNFDGTSVALSVKRRRILKRRRGDMDDLESNWSSWSTGSSQGMPKRPRRGMGLLPSTTTPETLSLYPKQDLTTICTPEAAIGSEKPTLLLCTCTEKSFSVTEPNYTQQETYCLAVDSIDDRLIGCCNQVSKPLLSRPSRKIPFQPLCEVHRCRLRAHHCCPGCGLFCTQGTFMQCWNTTEKRKSMHLFHQRCCQIYDGEALCPHCGGSSDWLLVRLRINSPRQPVFSLKQQPIRKQPSARITINRRNDVLMTEDTDDVEPSQTYWIPDIGKAFSSAGLPIGPERLHVEALLENLNADRLSGIKSQYLPQSFYAAAKNGDLEKILKMISKDFDPNYKFEDFDGETALHAASASGHLIACHILQQAGAFVDSLDGRLRTPIMVAVEHKKSTIIQFLIKAGAHMDVRGEDGMTVLHLAAKSGNLEACHLLLDTGKINVNIQDDGSWTPLVWAAEHNHKEIARFLLERGSDPNLRDSEYNIALHWAAYSGSLEICELFLNRSCDLNCTNEHGDTPLHIAARQDNYECVILFLARNADTTIRNRENELAIMCCPSESTQTWMALKMNAHLRHFASSRVTRSERILHKDISQGKEMNPIQCVNGIDDDSFPTNYLYIIENCETIPVNINRSITSLQGCSCEDNCATMKCRCNAMSLKSWYSKDGHLIPEFNLLDPPLIFECNRTCSCWKDCNNRVVQLGITCRLQLFRAKGKGWGVRTLRDIAKGTFICEYVGELISDSEADQREDDSYLFDLDNRDGETYCIDARHYGNIARFINHLCEPNLVPVKIFVDHHDYRFPRIAFFSSRDIRAYEELGFDYGEKFWIIKYKAFTCACASEKCRYSADKINEMLDIYTRKQVEEVPAESIKITEESAVTTTTTECDAAITNMASEEEEIIII